MFSLYSYDSHYCISINSIQQVRVIFERDIIHKIVNRDNSIDALCGVNKFRKGPLLPMPWTIIQYMQASIYMEHNNI